MKEDKILEADIEVNKEKWQERYKKEACFEYTLHNMPLAIKISSDYAKRFLLSESLDIPKIMLEAGCGTARTSLALSLEHKLEFVCADMSMNALNLAREHFVKNNPQAKVNFVCCDLRAMPFKNGSIDFIFSDGAIEHFKNTHLSLLEFLRILKTRGRAFVTVPYLSLGMLTYGQLQGNIPNISILRTILEFIHFNILRGRALSNGYELSFTLAQMQNLFKRAGFKNIQTGHFKTYNEIRFFKNKIIKEYFRRLSAMRIFWPLIYAYGVKL